MSMIITDMAAQASVASLCLKATYIPKDSYVKSTREQIIKCFRNPGVERQEWCLWFGGGGEAAFSLTARLACGNSCL